MTTTPYNSAKNPFHPMKGDIALAGVTIAKSDSTDLAKYVVGTVTVAGNIAFLPAGNTDDSASITITAAPVGYKIPWLIRRLLSTGTTATVASLDKMV